MHSAWKLPQLSSAEAHDVPEDKTLEGLVGEGKEGREGGRRKEAGRGISHSATRTSLDKRTKQETWPGGH